MTILQIAQLIATAIGIAVFFAGPVIFVMRLDGRTTLHAALLERIEKKLDQVNAAVEDLQRSLTMQQASKQQPARAGKGRRLRGR